MLKATLLAIGIVVFPIASTADAAQRSVDARNLNVAGVKIGMDWDQALAAAAEHFHAAPSDFKPGPKLGKTVLLL